jgi:hypothetical protein
MTEKLFQAWNGPTPTTAGQVKVTTGTAIKTMLQLSTPSTGGLYIVEWGISFDGSAAATPILCELLSCAGAATVTAYADADITRLTQTQQASTVAVGVNASGYTASLEGTPSALDMYDAQLIPPTGQYVKQWPLGREPEMEASRFLRVRVTAPAAVFALCYVVWGD